MFLKKSLFPVVMLTVMLASCKKDNTPEPENEEELITTVKLTFTPVNGGSDVVFTFQDLDGDGPNEPVITNGSLEDSTSYNMNVDFLNELEDPAEEITNEVKEESTEHQVFFLISNALNLDISYNDIDTEGNPLGVINTAQTGSASTGKLTVILRHQPNKNADGVKNGLIENAGGATDAQVEFSVSVK